MQNKIIDENIANEENEQYWKRKPTKYATKLVLDFLNDQSADFGFSTQAELQNHLKEYIGKHPEKFDSIPDQPNISRALTVAMKKTYLKAEQTFAFVKAKKCYFFFPKETVLTELFEFDYWKNSVHPLTSNTLVFSLNPDDHETFISVLKTKISPNMLWGHYSKQEFLFLMFDVERVDWQANYNTFREFFYRKLRYESFLNLTRK